MSLADVAALTDWISTWVRAELKITDPQIATDVPFTRFGMDSVHAMMMVGDLEEHLDRRLSPTLAWDYPTIASMASFLSGNGASASPASPASTEDALSRIDAMSEEELDQLLEQEHGER